MLLNWTCEFDSMVTDLCAHFTDIMQPNFLAMSTIFLQSK